MTSATNKPYTAHKVLSFDIFGTVIDWELGIYQYLHPLINQLPQDHALREPFPNPPPQGSKLASRHPLIVAFDDEERKLCATHPKMGYEELLRNSYLKLAENLDLQATDKDADALAASIPAWPAFPDSIAAMKTLAEHFKIVALSNVSNDSIRKVLGGSLGACRFDAVYTAEDVGSYKPARENFEYLLKGIEKSFGADQSALVHVAHGWRSDQVRPEEMGIVHVWVERGVDNRVGDGIEDMKWLRTVKDLKELADIVESEVAG